MSDELAKAIVEAVKQAYKRVEEVEKRSPYAGTAYAGLFAGVGSIAVAEVIPNVIAKAARDFYGIPPEAEKGAVGRLIDFHKRMLTGVVDADECRDILRAMGEKVAG